jgi:hypothetical protein
MKPKNNIRKRFIVAESDTLVIETIQTESETHRQRLRILKLKGTWRANAYNELVFEVTLRKGPPETYIFKGSWKLNKNQQIVYISEDGRDTLTFKGYWILPSFDRLVYIFEGSSTSRFEFKVQLESSVLNPKQGQIRYRIGIGIRQSRKTLPGQLLILYGEWKFGRNLGLTFQMDYGRDKVRSIEFGAKVTFGRNKVIFTLKNESGEPLGITITMTHKFLKSFDAEAFIRLKSRKDEYGVEAGLSIPF